MRNFSPNSETIMLRRVALNVQEGKRTGKDEERRKKENLIDSGEQNTQIHKDRSKET